MRRRQENIMPTTILHIALIIFLILMATVFLAPIPEEIKDYKITYICRSRIENTPKKFRK